MHHPNDSTRSIHSAGDALALAGAGAAIAVVAALGLHVTVGLTRLALFLAVG